MRKKSRFTVRTLVLLCAVIAVILAFWTNRIRTQQRITREVRALGGNVLTMEMDTKTVIYDYPHWLPHFMCPFTPSKVNYVLLAGEKIGDEQVAMAAKLPGIEGLDLNFSVITDATLKKLQRCKNLKELNIWDVSTVSEAAITEFRDKVPGCEVNRR